MITVATGAVAIVLSALNVIAPELISIVTLGLVTLLATTELVDKTRRLDQIEVTVKSELTKLREHSGTVDVRHFTNADAAFAYMVEAIGNADRAIDHAALATSVPRWSPAHASYEAAITKTLRSNSVRYRYLAALPEPSREKRMRRFLASPKINNFFARFVVTTATDGELTFHNFMVFEDRAVIINYPYSESEPERFLAIENPQVVKFYQDLFAHLWGRSSPFQADTPTITVDAKPTIVTS